MKAMQQAQPLIKELQAQFKDDKERLNKEMLALYKKIGFNPISGCLPLVLQIPIFIILFQVLRNPDQNGFIFVNQNFYGMDLMSMAFSKLSPDFLSNLHLIIPGMVDLSRLGIGFLSNTYLYVPALPVVAIMCVTTIIQQKMMTVDPQQKSMMWMMNLMIVYFAFMMPTGVLLYWGISNVLQLVQQALTKTNNAAQTAAASVKHGSGSNAKQVKITSNKPDNNTDSKKKKAVKKNVNELHFDSDNKSAEQGSQQSTSTSGSGSPKRTYPAGKQNTSKKGKKGKK